MDILITFSSIAILALGYYFIKYCIKTGIMNDDNKYLVFSEKSSFDKERMDPEEFEKMVAANKRQEEARIAHLKSKSN